MTEARHAAPGDGGFRASLLRNVAGALVLVVAVAALFWALGSVGRAPVDSGAAPGDGDVGGPGPNPDGDAGEDPDGDDPGEEEPGDPDGEDPDGNGGPDGEPGEGEPDGADVDEDPEPGDGPDGDGPDGDDPDGEPDEDPPPAIPPGDITLQVLDGYQQDGGSAADAVQAQLRDAGYRIIARNPAIRYDVTTVLWTAGHEDAARQVAAELDATEVRQQTNLSSSVMVHVVVGADRG